MSLSATQSGFTDLSGTVANIVDGNDSSGWIFGGYSDNTGKTITFDFGAWFDASTMAKIRVLAGNQIYSAGGFGMQVSADGTNWFNMPDNTSSIFLGLMTSTDQTFSFTPFASNTIRYVRLIGNGGANIDPGPGAPTIYKTISLQDSGGTPIVASGSNTNPPSGTPDTDNGLTPSDPADTNVPADVTGVHLAVARTDDAPVDVTGVHLAVARTDDAPIHVTGVHLAVASLVSRTRAFGYIVG